ncbi:SDR family NAD(P)-dependent oxidoreductase [Rhizobium leguminosarum]|uniref:SDR family NAD(P)-dependent oxidoreductase n=1 Tax=Rhizobium leguminosarum TaxID=384 RepID=A0A444I7B8_RHILE|nr:SDR family NAD(P)-dependent oxidoreductase [Rhizobium leguminosarum]RWX34207.1 SDR family NAD(P)-dependent oxidoreductase [Rhizobium leguminosarum]
MDMQLAGKRALITGSTSGIGAECARMLAAEGVSVVVNGRNSDRAQALVAEISGAGGKAKIAMGDVTSNRGCADVVNAANAAFGGIDILVNNVGNPTKESHPSWFDASLDEWIADFHQNTVAAVRLIHAFAPAMKAQRWGRLIQISSRNAISPHALFPSYGAAKAGLNNLTLSLSKELAGTGVTSNGVMPGLIYTPQLDQWFAETARQQGSDDPEVGKQFVLKNIIHQTVNRLGVPKDIATAVCFLASPLTDFMTGTTFRIDGGSTPTV